MVIWMRCAMDFSLHPTIRCEVLSVGDLPRCDVGKPTVTLQAMWVVFRVSRVYAVGPTVWWSNSVGCACIWECYSRIGFAANAKCNR